MDWDFILDIVCVDADDESQSLQHFLQLIMKSMLTVQCKGLKTKS